ncbi:hypothetical protein DP923_08815 [Pontibacter arcticus]|uniref:Uncharacterized protein n=1 Tax=Pontibacter arcticus TaxID=2080288 RepID=A0A364RG29_9BACT|nr:hypothetical protein DP923_08815 [Pontibacter arcticus]
MKMPEMASFVIYRMYKCSSNLWFSMAASLLEMLRDKVAGEGMIVVIASFKLASKCSQKLHYR